MGLVSATNPIPHFASSNEESKSIGQIDLLDGAGAVVSTWHINTPKCLLGSGPECSILLADPSIAKAHATLIFGKRHTLLKAHAQPTKIQERPVREWLIDQPTTVTLGTLRIVVHPSPCVASVVKANQLVECAERLGTRTAQPIAMPISSQPVVDPSVQRRRDDLQNNEAYLEFARSTERILESIQSQIAGLQESVETVRSSIAEETATDTAPPITIRSLSSTFEEIGGRWFSKLDQSISAHRDEQESKWNVFSSDLNQRLVAMDQQFQAVSELSNQGVQRFQELLAASNEGKLSIDTRFDQLVTERNQLIETIQELRSAVERLESNWNARESSNAYSDPGATAYYAPASHETYAPAPEAYGNPQDEEAYAPGYAPYPNSDSNSNDPNNAYPSSYFQGSMVAPSEYVETQDYAPQQHVEEQRERDASQPDALQQHDPDVEAVDAYAPQPHYPDTGGASSYTYYGSSDAIPSHETPYPDSGYAAEENAQHAAEAYAEQSFDAEQSYDESSEASYEQPRYDDSNDGPYQAPSVHDNRTDEEQANDANAEPVVGYQLPEWFTRGEDISVPSSSRDAEVLGDNSPQDALQSDQTNVESQSHGPRVAEQAHYPPQAPGESLVPNAADAEMTFPADDSISDRLQRMLADAESRRQNSTKPKTESPHPRRWSEVYKETNVNALGASQDSNPSSVPSTPILERSLLDALRKESTSLQESAPEGLEVPPKATLHEKLEPVDVRAEAVEETEEPNEELPQPEVSSRHNSENSAHSHPEEESIEEYMQRLLQRVRTGPDAEPPKGNTPARPPKSPVNVPKPIAVEATANESAVKNDREDTQAKLSKEEFVPRQQAPERKVELNAMREIANSSARHALHRSDQRRVSSAFLFKLAITAIAVTTAVMLLLLNGFKLNAPFAGMLAAMATAAIWGYDCLNHFRNLASKNQTTPEAEDRGEHGPNPAPQEHRFEAPATAQVQPQTTSTATPGWRPTSTL